MPTHIIVGGGASGILACYELLQHGHDVILLEAGSETYQTSSDCYLAQNWGRSFNAGNVEVYQYLTTPQPCLNHRQIEYPQGAGLGGSTNINAMIWSEGYPAVYDRHWPKSWSAQFVGKLMTYVFDVVRPDITDSRGCMQQILNMVYRKKEAKTGGSFDDLDNPDFAIKSVMPSYFTMTTFQPPKLSSCKMDGNLKGDHVYRKQLAHVLLDVPEDKKKDIGTLTVIGNAEARRVVFRDRKAVSVEYYCKKSDRIKTCEVGVAGEIILCAGAFGTPRILLSTGLGEVPEKASTSSAGDDNGANVTISDIGRNLQDHVILPFFFLGNWKAFRDQCESTGGAMGSAKNSMKQRLKRAANLKMKDAMDRNRMYPGNSVHGWIHLDSEGEIYDEINSSDVPSAQICLGDGRILVGLYPSVLPVYPLDCAPIYMKYLRPFLINIMHVLFSISLVRWLAENYLFGFLVCLVRPKSKGCLVRDEDDGSANQTSVKPLHVDLQTFSDDEDIRVMHNASWQMRRIVGQFKAHVNMPSLEVIPGPLFNYTNSKVQFESYAKLFCKPYFHACGTCGMQATEQRRPSESRDEDRGSRSSRKSSDFVDEGSHMDGQGMSSTELCFSQGAGVVNDRLCVHGVYGLRVADSSIVPSEGISTHPISALCMAIGVAVARFVIEDSGAHESKENL